MTGCWSYSSLLAVLNLAQYCFGRGLVCGFTAMPGFGKFAASTSSLKSASSVLSQVTAESRWSPSLSFSYSDVDEAFSQLYSSCSAGGVVVKEHTSIEDALGAAVLLATPLKAQPLTVASSLIENVTCAYSCVLCHSSLGPDYGGFFCSLCWLQDFQACVEHPAFVACLLYTSPSPRDLSTSRMPSSA